MFTRHRRMVGGCVIPKDSVKTELDTLKCARRTARDAAPQNLSKSGTLLKSPAGQMLLGYFKVNRSSSSWHKIAQ